MKWLRTKEVEATERLVDVDNVVQHQPEVEALELGALGLHLGWFKNNPQLAGLPSGMRLESEMGNQGLRRWVLILPQDMADLKMTALSKLACTSWIGRCVRGALAWGFLAQRAIP